MVWQIECEQGEEPDELLELLGGTLVIRQGPRDLFSADNTAVLAMSLHAAATRFRLTLPPGVSPQLYAVTHDRTSRRMHIDQVDLLPSTLTSRHPLVLSVLGQTFLHIARGALDEEIFAARSYARTLADGSDVVELREGDRTPEGGELFWMCFGDEEDGHSQGSRADFWRWRGREGGDIRMRAWRVDGSAVDLASRVSGVSAPCVLESFANSLFWFVAGHRAPVRSSGPDFWGGPGRVHLALLLRVLCRRLV